MVMRHFARRSIELLNLNAQVAVGVWSFLRIGEINVLSRTADTGTAVGLYLGVTRRFHRQLYAFCEIT